MKNIYKPFLLILLSLISFSCEDELVEKAILESNPDPNVLSDLPASSYNLVFDEKDDNFDEFEWSASDYGFQASVIYTVQIDVSGSDFSDAVNLISTQDLSATLTNGQINAVLLTLGLTPEQPTDVQIRVMSSILDSGDPVYSNLITVTMSSFATTFEPIYIIGDAQGWDLLAAAELKATGPGTFEGAAEFVTDGIFRFFATPAWDADQWGASFFAGGTLPPELVDNGDGDSNFRFTGTDGFYFVSVNLNTKTITMEEQNFPTRLYIIGDDQEWNLDAALELTHLGNGVFEAYGTFGSGNIWRFFEAPDWAATQWNYNTFLGGTIDSDLSGTTEGDANFTFNGATGIYKITVSTVDLTIDMEPANEPTVFIIGDDQGWNLGNAFQLTWLGGSKYEGTTTFNNGSIFRFFAAADWAAQQWNYNTFLDGTIDETNLSGTTEGDANFTFIGTSGTYTMSVDLLNLTIEMNQ